MRGNLKWLSRISSVNIARLDDQLGKNVKVLLADDHQVIRDLVSQLVKDQMQAEVVLSSDFDSTLAELDRHGAFDIILLDYAMPGMKGVDSVEEIVRRNMTKPVILFTGIESKTLLMNALGVGIKGVIPKSAPASAIPDIIRFVLGGQTYMPPELLAAGPAEAAGISLSRREREMLGYLRAGLTNREIAIRSEISDATVKLHIRNLCGKLGAKNRTQAVMIAEDYGL